MSGKSRQESQEPLLSEPAERAAGMEDDESLLAMVERAVEYLGNDPEAPPNRGNTYSRAFPVGEAIGRLFWKRCVEGDGPYGLAVLIEHMLGLAPATSRNRIRRALFSGFCWQLEQLTHAALEKPGEPAGVQSLRPGTGAATVDEAGKPST